MSALRRLWKDNRGIATSLMEVTLVLAITAVISAVAIALTNSQLDAANIQSATGEVKLLGVSILAFMQDTGKTPAFKQGTATGPADDFFPMLESGGNEPADLTDSWPKPDTRDNMANQLTDNNPGKSGVPYLRMGEIGYARHQGWGGPYLTKIPSSDPWGMKYLVNIGFATTQGAKTLGLGIGRKPSVFVTSAGPNQVLETQYAQISDSFNAGGDDIVFRIQ